MFSRNLRAPAPIPFPASHRRPPRRKTNAVEEQQGRKTPRRSRREPGTTREERLDGGASQMVCSNFCRCVGTRSECGCVYVPTGYCRNCGRPMREIWMDTGETVRRSA